MTDKELATRAGVSPATWKRWKQRQVPLPKRRETDEAWLARIAEWKRSALQKVGRKPETPGLSEGSMIANGGEEAREVALWTARSRKALTKQRELALARELGEYMPRAQVEQEWVKRVLVVRAGLLRLPRQVAARCGRKDPELIEVEVRGLVLEFLRAFEMDGEYAPAARLPASNEERTEPDA